MINIMIMINMRVLGAGLMAPGLPFVSLVYKTNLNYCFRNVLCNFLCFVPPHTFVQHLQPLIEQCAPGRNCGGRDAVLAGQHIGQGGFARLAAVRLMEMQRGAQGGKCGGAILVSRIGNHWFDHGVV